MDQFLDQHGLADACAAEQTLYAQGASYLYLLRIVGGYNAPPSLILRNYLWLLRFSFTSTLRL